MEYKIKLKFSQYKFKISLCDLTKIDIPYIKSHNDDSDNSDNSDEYDQTENTLSVLDDLKIDSSQYKFILYQEVPMPMININGTGYAYEDVSYNIYFNKKFEKFVAKGNTSKSYEIHKYINYQNNAYCYPSKYMDFIILNGQLMSANENTCILLFGIKKHSK